MQNNENLKQFVLQLPYDKSCKQNSISVYIYKFISNFIQLEIVLKNTSACTLLNCIRNKTGTHFVFVRSWATN